MPSISDIISGLTSVNSSNTFDKQSLVNQFSDELGWMPSYSMTPSKEKDYVSTHLIVEHGLENSAVITFLTKPYYDLNAHQRNDLLNISYNNLVDWHIHVEKNSILYINNRVKSSDKVVRESKFYRDNYDALRSEAFEMVVGEKISSNIPALDTALIDTVNYWKIHLAAEFDNELSNTALSSLFNCIFFIRALEDNTKRYYPEKIKNKVLIESLNGITKDSTLSDIFLNALDILDYGSIPDYLIDFNNLSIFSDVSNDVWSYVFNDFYENRLTNLYSYDFSIMSHHALSRIYERYISILSLENTPQTSLFTPLATNDNIKEQGSVFTPQYIARFFSRYLQENIPPFELRNVKVFEPSVGSGMFLRTFLEITCDPRLKSVDTSYINNFFQNVTGVDIDKNAVKATQLSLALLHLTLTDSFPEMLNISQENTLDFYLNELEASNKLEITSPSVGKKYDVVISNPPYISVENQDVQTKEKIKRIMGNLSSGRTDIYLAFIKLSLDSLKEGGYALFVLPHSFLISKNAEKLRMYIYQNFTINCIVDLSTIPVFGNTGIYTILLIVKKEVNTSSSTLIVKCKNSVGKALQATLKKEIQGNQDFSIYDVNRDFFLNKKWFVLPKKEIDLKYKLEKHNPIGDFLEVKQGFVSGNDQIFIVSENEVEKLDRNLFIPYLPDKKMEKYVIMEENTKQYLFFPYINGEKIELSDIMKNYPATWNYFLNKKDDMMKPKGSKESNWIYPHRARPNNILNKKIIAPHLMFTQKFSIDLEGKYAVSRTPFLYTKKMDSKKLNDEDMLKYFVAVLNSSACFWYISNHSHKYSQSYTMIEVKTLKDTPVPNPYLIPRGKLNQILRLVEDRIHEKGYQATLLERKIDALIAEIYGLSIEDQKTLGIIDEM